MRKLVLLSLTVLFAFTASAQDFSNKGTDFWVGYGYHQVMNGNNGQNMVIYIATEAASVVTIAIPGVGYSQTYNLPANTIFTTPAMPKNGAQDSRLNTIGLLDRGIHVTSDIPIVAYAHIYNSSVSGACVLLPTNTLGKEYYSINYTNNSNTADANCWFYVIATEPGTTDVEITPSQDAIGHPAGIPFTVTLTQGQIFNVMGTTAGNFGTDLTGSVVRSLAGAGVCKRIGVFSGSGRIYINCGSGNNSSDNYMVQAFPKAAWGRTYLTAPTAGSMTRNIYRICVSDRLAVVKINGAVTTLPLINNFYYEIPATNVPQLIEADLPITVAQYITTQGACGNGTPGDPEVIYLSPVEQNIKNVLFNSNLLVNSPNPPNPPHQHWVHAVIPNGGTALSSFSIDGAPPVQPFIVHPQNPAYSYIQIPLAQGQHRLVSDSGFNAIAYGYAATESYGYNAGTNVIDLSQQMEVESQYGIETNPSVCTDALFRFKAYFPDSSLSATPTEIRFDSIKWTVSNPAVFVPNNFPVMINGTVGTPPKVAIDSVNIRNGRQVAWYSIPGQYSVTTPGVYDVTITTYRSSSEGCGNEQVYTFQLVVTAPPIPSYTYTPGKCVAEPYQFTETTPQAPKPTYRWYWNFGDPGSGANNISTVRNPTHTFSAPGTYTVKYVANTTPGCLTDTVSQQIIVDPLPSAIIDGTTSVCLNAPPPPVVFTGSGSTAGAYTYYYKITPGGVQPPLIGGNVVTINAPTNVAGSFVYTLDSVRVTGSTLCVQSIAGQQVTINVNPLPTATISGSATVCRNAASPNITFTGAAATAPYTFSYTINGGPVQTVTTVAGNSVTVPVSTATAGTFTYTLVSVQDGSSTACTQVQAGSAIVVINPLPTASISGTLAVCRNAASPNITFTGAAGTSPYTFSYTINGGPVQTVTTAVGNSVTVSVPTGTIGTYTYTLVSVQDGSSTTCSQAQTGSAIITVNDLPTATIAGTIAVCQNGPQPLVTFTGANTTAPYTFTYTVNGGPVQSVTTIAGNSVTVPVSTAVAGVYTYALVSVQDGTSTACNQAQTGSAVVTVNPLPTASIGGSIAVCLNAPSPNVTFTGAVGLAPYTFSYTINGGPVQTVTTVAGNSVTVPVPTGTAGTFTYALVSVRDASTTTCLNAQTGSAVVIVNPLPTASISGATTVCQNSVAPNVTFTGASGTAPYTFSYRINGGPILTATTVAGNSVNVPASTAVVGTFTYTLVSVQDGTSTACTQAQTGTVIITVNPLPTASISGTIAVCRNAAAPNITFTGANTIAPYTFSYTINGGPVQTVTTVAGNSVTVSVPTATAGTYTYTLVSVQDASSTTCSQAQTGSAVVTVNPLPTASISGTLAVCRNAAAPNITFTGATGTAPYTFSYTINGGPVQTVTTVAGNSVTVSVPTGTVGTYTYALVSVQDGSTTTCTQAQTGSATITVNDLPTATIGGTTTVCQNSPAPNITFTGANTSAPYTFSYRINGGPILTATTVAGNSVTVAASTAVPGIFTYTLVSVQDGTGTACSQAQVGSAIVTVNPLPTASIAGTTAVCLNAASPNVTFTGAVGTAPYTFSYTINGGPVQTITTVAGNSITLAVPTTVAGTFTYALVSVRDASSTLCSQAQTGSATVTVNPLPTATISGTITVCQNSASPNITFTGAAATAPYTFSYRINGGPVLTATTVAGNSVTVPVSTATIGTYTYTLISVQDGSSTACSQAQAGTATVVVNPLPTASIAGTIAVCQNAASPNITFTGASTVAPYTFVYTINGGPNQTVTTTVGNSVTVAVPTAVVGTFTYTLVSVQDGTATACSQAQTGSAVVTVNPLPTGAITGSKLVCINSASPDITFTAASGTAPYTFTYTINGGAPQVITTTGANTSVTLPASTAVAGVFTYKLVSVRDGSSTACVQAMNVADVVIDVSNVFPNTNFSFTNSVCIPNALVQFQNLSNIANGTPLTYSWNFGDGSPLSAALNPSHTYNFVGPYNVLLRATSNAGCVTDRVIPMNNIHPQPKADFSFSNPAGVCIGDAVTLTDLTDGKDGIVNQWNWDMGDATILTTNPVSYTYTTAKTYTVTLFTVNSMGCNSDTISKTFTVHPYPVVDAGPDRFILEGGQITLAPVVTGNDLQFVWTPNQYLIDNKIEKVKVNKPLTDMIYTLTVTARGGCTASDVMFVKLLKFPKIPNTFTPNGDGINDKWNIDYLNTYPDNRVQVFTRTGQLVFESRGYNTPWDGTIKGKPLPFDTYYYIIEPGNGRDPLTGYVTIIK